MRLTPWEKRWFEAIMEGFAPPTSDVGLAPQPGEVDYARAFEELNGHASPIAQAGLRAAIHLIGTSPTWTGTKAATIDQLPIPERTALIEKLVAHPQLLVRELTWLIKVQGSMALFGTASIRARSNYDRQRADKTPVRLRTKSAARTEVA
ncbi:MAG: hypothetical protein KC586_19675 [Myxococcales bacterium]|nr:hypothetical protein [Myxococcales bacterium]